MINLDQEKFLIIPYSRVDSEIKKTLLEETEQSKFELKEKLDHRQRILIVDDSEINRMIIREYLKNANYLITEAENGKMAIEKVLGAPFDLILMDIQMPIMDGYRATQEIRAWENKNQKPHTPIIAVSAYALKEEVDKSLKAGCDLHLSKPIIKKILIEALKDFGIS